eukprot:TRINITY_DN14320_c0_g1_i1.p1 TRINITY_DN14320_c0_g1~~TRINITY_DN14320_c0_g1_i1.p1  ORF type:complete len:179 (+),score=39.80 TRINITY_DN14320_c0_g1_i1:149-685(+)
MDGLPKVRAKHSYTAQTENELSFKKGDILTIMGMRDDDWWEGCDADGNEGFVAAKYVEHKPIWMSAATSPPEEEGVALIEPKPVMPSQVPIPNLAKALHMHHVKAKHEVTASPSNNNGLLEFKRQHNLVRQGIVKQSSETELQRRLRERAESSNKAQAAQENQSEFQRKFSERFRKPE